MTEEQTLTGYDKSNTMRARTILLVGAIAAVVATLAIVFRQEATVGRIVVAGGVLFVGAGVFDLLFFNDGSGMNRALTSLTNTAAIVLGVCMLVFRDAFATMIPFIFGLVVVLCALWQFYTLAVGIRPFTLHAGYYFFPLILIGFAVYIFIARDGIDDVSVLTISGVAIGIFATVTIIEGVQIGLLHRKVMPKADDTSADLDDPIEPDTTEQPEAAASESTTEVTTDLDDPYDD